LAKSGAVGCKAEPLVRISPAKLLQPRCLSQAIVRYLPQPPNLLVRFFPFILSIENYDPSFFLVPFYILFTLK
jgi:hypothetical protein